MKVLALRSRCDLADGGLDLVEVEWGFAWNRAVEAGLKEARPLVAELVGSTLVTFADTSHPRVDTLERRTNIAKCTV